MAEKAKPKRHPTQPDVPAFGREYDPGLTKREYIATQMMSAQRLAFPDGRAGDIANCAVHDADSLIEALNGPA